MVPPTISLAYRLGLAHQLEQARRLGLASCPGLAESTKFYDPGTGCRSNTFWGSPRCLRLA